MNLLKETVITMNTSDDAPVCDQCYGYNYELLGCCNGRDCGCMGLPVDAIPCPKCNPDGKKEPSSQAKKDWPWFFADKMD